MRETIADIFRHIMLFFSELSCEMGLHDYVKYKNIFYCKKCGKIK